MAVSSNSEYKTTYGDLKKYMATISDGILEIIKQYHLTDELENGNHTDFSPNLAVLIKREWSWATKNPDLIMDMLSEVYIRVFVSRANTVFTNYFPKSHEKHEAGLEAYLHFILKRAFQEISKLNYNELKRFKEINPMDGQSVEDAFDNAMNNQKIKTTTEYANRIEDLKELISYHEDRIRHVIDNEPHAGAKLKSLKDKIDKLEEELDYVIRDSMFTKKESYDKYDLEAPMSHDEKLFFEQLIHDLKDVIKKHEANPDPQLKVFSLLIDDYSPSEIARKMEVSPAKISQRIKKLKDSLVELAHVYKENGDDDLYNSLNKLLKSNVKRTANRLQHDK